MNATKHSLSFKLSYKTGKEQKEMYNVITAFFEVLQEEMHLGHRVEVRDFGVLKPITTKPKKGQDMQRGKTIDIPSKKTYKFYISPNLEKTINKTMAQHITDRDF